MASNTISSGIDGGAELLIRAALEHLETAKDELVLDFSAVRRIDPAALRAMEELAAKARDRSVNVVLRGVHVDVYKVLTLVAVGTQFSFLN